MHGRLKSVSYPKISMLEYTLFSIRIPSFFQASKFLNFSNFEPRIILKLLLINKGVPFPKNLWNIFRSLLMFYYIIKSKGL